MHTVAELDLLETASGLLLTLGDHTAIIGVYRSPSSENISIFLQSLDQVFSSLSTFKTIVFTGDINIDIKPSALDSRSHDYLNRLALHGFMHTHEFPTRGPNCLDHVFLRTKFPSLTFVLESPTTDHLPILIFIEQKLTKAKSADTYSKIDYSSLDMAMKSLDLSHVISDTDPESATDGLLLTLTSTLEKHTTIVNVRRRDTIVKPWITPGLLRCMRNRDNLHKKLKADPNNETLKITYTGTFALKL